ncbi:hypothetical protein BJP36_05750 [Moorena producens JHB]|uniref:Uncharacterized protein n=1 Tax=Moorena producens (strain JHB) TaxID=1454205 RepID=A0A9Q9STH3_MOOP1|nr:hypothetical protein [Moorena producens]WAN69343.1 hypothetical protein BJP36_05750 [Moorena producens JHB]
MGRWGDGEMGRVWEVWGDGEMGRWGDREMGSGGSDRVFHSYEVHRIFSLFPLFPSWEGLGVGSCSLFPIPDSRFPIPDSRFPTPDSLGALSVGELNSPRVAPLPTPDSRLPRCAFRWRIKFATGRTAPDSLFPTPYSLLPYDSINP